MHVKNRTRKETMHKTPEELISTDGVQSILRRCAQRSDALPATEGLLSYETQIANSLCKCLDIDRGDALDRLFVASLTH